MTADRMAMDKSKAKCQTQADICFKPLSEEEATEMGINLYFNPYRFVCAQIPGVGLDETFIFDGVNNANQDVRLQIIDILSYLREYLARIRYLQNQVLTQAKEIHPNFYKDYHSKLANVEAAFGKHCEAVEAAMKNSGDDGFFGQFVHSFAEEELPSLIKSYLKEFGRLKNGANEVSHELSEEHLERLNGETIFQVMMSPLQWCKKIGEMTMNLAKSVKTFPEFRKDMVHLLKFAGNISNIVDSR